MATRFRILLVLVLLGTATLATPEKTHAAILRTEHFEIRYRPGSRAGAAAPRAGSRAERDLARICRELAVENDGSYRLFLYDDAAELAAITGVKGVGAFASGRDVHLPIGSGQTRAHEIAHVVTVRLKKTGDEPRNMAFPDGIANALLTYVHGVHVHAVARVYQKKRQLPSLKEITGVADFYGWLAKHPGFNGYDVAASWFRFLIDTYGIEKTKRYYTGTTPQDAFGKSLAVLEKDWHKALAAFPLTPEVEKLVRRKQGEAVTFDVYPLDPFQRLPKKLRGKPSAWKELKAESMRSDTPNWVWQDLGRKKFKNAIIEAVLRPSPGAAGVCVRFGDKCKALVVQPGVFLFTEGRALTMTKDFLLGRRDEVHVAFVRRGDEVEIWVDGFRVVSGRTAMSVAKPGVGIAGGTLTITRFRVRALR